MSTKRTPDPTDGIFGDRTRIELDGDEGDLMSVFGLLKANSPQARIDALRDTPQLVARRGRQGEQQSVVEELTDWLDRLEGRANQALMLAIQTAEATRVKAKAAPDLIRDKKRQAGTKRPRRPDIDAWIDKRLEADPSAKSPGLWADAPEWLTDQIGYERFTKRVTAARKKLNGR